MNRFRTLLPTQVALGDSTTLVGLYVSGAWCPPCRHFTPLFAAAYQKLGRGSGLEIIYCSCDFDGQSYDRYFFQSPCPQPWLAVPFFKGVGHGGLPYYLPQNMLKYIQGVPSLVIFERQTGKIVCGYGRDVIASKNFDLKACVDEWGKQVRSHKECAVENPEADKCDLGPVLENRTVVIQGLQKAPQHNDKVGKVLKWDGPKTRCTVDLDGTQVEVRPANFIQRCSARIDGDEHVYDGSACTILGYSDGHYKVRVNNSMCCAICPSNIVLERDTCVKISGLDKHAELNGELGKIEEVIMEKRRYAVHLEKGSRISVKLENVIC
jgi:nucleoredoxin